MFVAATTVREATELVAELVWLVLLAAFLAGVAAFLYRWYVREPVPAGLSLLVGLAGVTVYLNTSRALGQVIGGSTLPTEREVALFNVAAFALAAGGAVLGRRAGDRLGDDFASRTTTEGVERDVGRIVETVGRVTAVELPGEIEDVVGYDPVPAETREKLAGRTFLFPRRLTVEELRDRLVSRLRADYAVGHVDVDLAADGTVEYLALGSRAAGIGPTLPPETNAVAVRADPAFAASAGDLVQVWEPDASRRLLTAELRGVADDVVTLAIDAGDTNKVDPHTEYRLVTLPVGDRPDREFASLLRAADETFSSVVVAAGSPLHGMPVGALDVGVIAVKPEDGKPVGIPEPGHALAPGDRVFAIARPDALRRLEAAAEPVGPSLAPDSGVDAAPPASEEPRAPADQDGTVAGDTAGTAAAGTATPDSSEGTSAEATEAPPAEEPSTEATGGESSAGETEPDDEAAIEGRADASSFQDLKAEFESGEAEWSEEVGDDGASVVEDRGDDEHPSDEVADGDEEVSPLDGGESADGDRSGLDIEEGDDDLALDVEADDGDTLSDLDVDESDDDLASLDFDTDESDDLDLADLDDEFGGTLGDEEIAGDGEDDEEDEDEEGEDDGGGDDGSGGGGKSFQDLKEEFESGDADWADDVSDSPGGDMRLDE